MEPGGSHGLQNRSRPDHVGLGGFDSHALPPSRSVAAESRSFLSTMPLICQIDCRTRSSACSPARRCRVAAQSADRMRVDQRYGRVAAIRFEPPIAPRRAFFYSFLVPGYSQAVLGRNKAAAAFMLVEAISLAMIRESAAMCTKRVAS